MTVKNRLLNVFLEEEWAMSVAEEITQLRRIADDIDEAESNGARLTHHGELHRRYLELLEREGRAWTPGSAGRFGSCSTGPAPRRARACVMPPEVGTVHVSSQHPHVVNVSHRRTITSS